MAKLLRALVCVFADALLGGELAFILGFFLLALLPHRGR